MKINPLYNFKTDHEYVSAIIELKRNFTESRERIGKYLEDEKLVSAYFKFYTPTNIPKFEQLLNRLPIELRTAILDSDFIDYGSGPGTFSYAFLAAGGKGEVVCYDKSEMMLKQAKIFLSDNFKDHKVHYYNESNLTPLKLRQKVLFFGHSLNEMVLSEVEHLIKVLNPQFVLWIEPGTKSFFEQSLKIREYLLHEKFNLHYPCLHVKKCGLEGDELNWCHQYFHLKHDPEVERISQIAKIDRRNTAAIAHVYSKQNFKNNFEATIIADFPSNKFMKKFILCLTDQKIVSFESMFRGLSKSEIKLLESLEVGEHVKFTLDKKLTDENWRGKLILNTQD